MTLRRSSTTPYAKSTAEDAQASEPDVSPASRYLKNMLLDGVNASNGSISELYTGKWDPGHTNGGTNGRGWGRSEGADTTTTHIGWDGNGSVNPIVADEMSELEQTLFNDSVNSPMKPPVQNAKELNGQGSANGRKISVGSGNFGGLSSPISGRPNNRRQQTSDSITGLASPAGNGRFMRDEPSPFLRKDFGTKETSDDRVDDAKHSSPFGALMRSNTAGSNIPTSPWGGAPSSATMGSFGSFALGSSANPGTPTDKRPAFGNMRGESRLAHLMNKDSSEEVNSKTAEKSWRRPRTDTDPFGDDNQTGSAALGGGQDNSPPFTGSRRVLGLDTPTRGGSSSEFGMSDLPNFRDSRGQSQQTPQGRPAEEPLSPTVTNPYQTPQADDHGEEGYDADPPQQSRVQGLGGIPEHVPNAFGNRFSTGAFEGSDRSQNSSRGLPGAGIGALASLNNLSTLGGIGGWPTSGNTMGTPDRENRPGFPSAFGNSLFGPAGELPSPGFGAFGGNMMGPGSSSATNTLGRGSKLGSLFPAAMQAQMQGVENENPADAGEMRQNLAFGSIGRDAFSRNTDSPMRTGRGIFDDGFQQAEPSQSQGFFSSSEGPQGKAATSFPQAPPQQAYQQQSQPSSDAGSGQMPTSQQRTMVMPDRMRWVYLDPQGQVQGPWSGLEMHDWYKANFFTADLSVRKAEDAEFEPLGQLIRRIGNSREPFLVPQIGIAHGTPAPQAGTQFTPATPGGVPGGAAAQAGSVQPPFAGAFPSFGTTLTAEQQNNLERRKQEEQYLMARQREFLAQQQVGLKQQQLHGLPSSLHHHSSVHSLQSQPSFGSMTSPIGMPSQAPSANISGFFDGTSRQAPAQTSAGIPIDYFREEELSQLSLVDRKNLFGATSQSTHAQQVSAIFGQQADAQREAIRMEQLRQGDPQGFRSRLGEFNQLRTQHDLEEVGQAIGSLPNEPIGPPPPQQAHPQFFDQAEPNQQVEEPRSDLPEVLSLTQQVQKAASAKQTPLPPAPQSESPWATVNSDIPMPFPPPPQSTTPLPAPTAQRGRSNLPEALSIEDSSRSETPEVVAAPPSIAPWATAPVEAPRGLSLKDIQEMEAKKAAKQEAAAAAARRAAHEEEMKQLLAQPALPAPGLPMSSTWGNTASPAAVAPPSPWTTHAHPKSQASTSSAVSKKTLADIQREEESRKAKLAAAAAAALPVTGTAGGKRYADLASKPTAMPTGAGGAWATVGAGGKAKIPTGPAASAPQSLRSASSTVIPTAAARAPRPAPAVRSVTASTQTNINLAKDEFNKWAKYVLAKGLNSDAKRKLFRCSIMT